jgi:predicted kinase
MSHPKLTICRGLPASGKSSWSREQVRNDLGNTVRITRDLLRLMLNDNEFIRQITEPITVSGRNFLMRGYLKQGKHVIVDDTNLDGKTVKDLVKIGQFFGAEIVFKDFDVDVDTCVERDRLRESKGEVTVGENVVRDMAKRYFVNGHLPSPPENNHGVSFEPFVFNENTSSCVIFDIDGTLADHQGIRSPYDYTKVIRDRPRMAIIKAARLYYNAGYDLVICSGREDSCREDTKTWLDTYLSYVNNAGDLIKVPYALFMRETGDKRQDRIIKGEIFDKYIRYNWNPEIVYDDRDAVVALWRNDLRLDCNQVNYGDF